MSAIKYNILMFSPGFPPYCSSENIVAGKLALALLDRGHQMTIMSRADDSPMYSVDWEPEWEPLKPHLTEIHYEHGNALQRSVDLARCTASAGHPIAGVRWAVRAFEAALAAHKTRAFDVVLSRSPQDVGHLPALMLNRSVSIPWVANWNDPPAHQWPAPYKSENGYQAVVSDRYVTDVLNHAHLNTFPNARLRDHILGESRSEYAFNIVPHIGLGPIETPERDAVDAFRLCHAGNLSMERFPAPFLDGLAVYRAEAGNRPIEFHVLGKVANQLRELAVEKGLGDIIIEHGAKTYFESRRFMASFDCLVAIEAPCVSGIFFPSKIVDYIDAGRLILSVSPSNGYMTDFLANSDFGVAADCTDKDDIAKALSVLDERVCSSKEGAARHYTELELFTPDSVASQYECLLSEIIGE
jgi:hypothetical protein